MLTKIHIFSESRRGGTWRADSADTFLVDPPTQYGWVKATMAPLPCPEDYRLYGLLVDEVRHSWPWSMHERGIPDDASLEVETLSKSWGVDGHSHSHMSLQDLAEMALRLLLDPRPEAGMLHSLLAQLIRSVCETGDRRVDPEDRRVVFWFDS